jgi:hypothetical protein
MTGQQAPPAPPAQKLTSRQARLRQANLGILIMLVLQYALGSGVNLYVTLPPAGAAGRNKDQFFSNGPLLAIHAALGILMVITAIVVLVRAILARHVTLMVTSAAGLVAIIVAAIYGAQFTSKVTNGYSLGMALATAAALACYAIGLFAAPVRPRAPD